MKVAFNSFPLQSEHQTRGIGSYTKNLLAELKKDPAIKIQEFSDLSEVRDVDLVHYPFFDLFQNSLPLRKNFPTVITIHDVTPLVFPDYYPSGLRGVLNLLLQKLALRSVKAIITDSVASKKDLTKYLDINPEIIFPVYLAASAGFKKINNQQMLDMVAKKYNLPQRYVLYFGNVNWNKNLNNLAAAAMLANIDLVLVGKSFGERNNLNHPELTSFIEFLKGFKDNPKVHIFDYLPEEDLVSLINLAKLVLLPSFYEGFGLPILEAQACGTPVITGNISSMPEVGGEGVLYVGPDDVNGISEAIKKIINDSGLKEDLVSKGFKNVNKFSWKRTAQETIKVYQYASQK